MAPELTMRRVYAATTATDAVEMSLRSLKARAESATRRDGRRRVWERGAGHPMNTSLFDADWIDAIIAADGHTPPDAPPAVVGVPQEAGDPTPAVAIGAATSGTPHALQAPTSAPDPAVDDLVARLTEAAELERRSADAHNTERLEAIISSREETVTYLQGQLDAANRRIAQLGSMVAAQADLVSMSVTSSAD